ncbi:hypothetical protein ACQV2E_01860 [Pantoea allii]|uniref:hypothetical protein n=1 Tax=Pantoea allii TaxID=574096 RepID=UPI003D3147F1
MLNHLKISLYLSKKVTAKIIQANGEQLESIKDEMTDEMEVPIGWHTMGLPLIASVMLTLISFSIPQLSLWLFVYDLMGWQKHTVFIGIVATAAIYSITLFPTMMMVSRGAYLALKLYLSLMLFTLLLASLFLLFAIVSLMSGNNPYSLSFSGALLSVGLSLIALKCLDSQMFYKSCAFFLHNRAWRKQIKARRKINHPYTIK